MRLRTFLAATLALLAAAAAGAGAAWAETVRFDSGSALAEHDATLTAEFDLPAGEGPFPAVVLLHGCAGLSDTVEAGLRAHAAFLEAHGFATLIVDSFGPRGLGDGRVCSDLNALAQARWYRVADAFAARAWLAARPEIDGRAIFLIGQSNGGSVAVLAAKPRALRDHPGAEPFAGVVAYYPWCGVIGNDLDFASPLLLLLGGADDWVPSSACAEKAARADDDRLSAIVYQGAHHSFDLAVPVQSYAGHTVGGDFAATEASRTAYLAFFEGISRR
ncbi:Dienelactone hydrolase [Tistlia consotensis]|uniref:Dienelactone hydrolase n=2 Tax=Tistlia TaxID=1321364 RepID=A0A1Y6C535_9PROT|nr:Dienelactone hydrolase [Tistlia consotensis USBA 355]SNR42766.1 Dienelactone hydrolase [Tistlia consotensis]